MNGENMLRFFEVAPFLSIRGTKGVSHRETEQRTRATRQRRSGGGGILKDGEWTGRWKYRGTSPPLALGKRDGGKRSPICTVKMKGER